jgi:hypothetical protein
MLGDYLGMTWKFIGLTSTEKIILDSSGIQFKYYK